MLAGAPAASCWLGGITSRQSPACHNMEHGKLTSSPSGPDSTMLTFASAGVYAVY